MNYHFIDKIIELNKGKRILAQKSFAMTEEYFDHHFPRSDRIPNSLILEAVADAAALLIFATTEFSALALLLMINEAEFHKPLTAGDQMLLDVRLVSEQDYAALFESTVTVEEYLVVQTTITLGLFRLTDIDEPQKREVFMSLLQNTEKFIEYYTVSTGNTSPRS
jgi:3-hydroxyacyl-[acyl-carrier-protein] dehydratase